MASRRMRRSKRRGTILVFVAIFSVPLIGIVALAVDYGHLMKIRSDLQRYADCTALAAVQGLVPDEMGNQDLDAVRAATREYVVKNLGAGFTVLDSDIEIGRYDPNTIYSQVTLLNSGIYDTLRVKLRRDSSANSAVPLFFANVFGMSSSDVVASSTAVLQKGRFLPPGADVLPFAVPEAEWDTLSEGDEWSIYGDGKILDDDGNTIPGNWGTLDIGSEANSTSDLGDQVVNGLDQSDLNHLETDGRIDDAEYIDSQEPVWLQADPGISTGMKSYVREIHGLNRIVPIYKEIANNGGNNLEYRVIKWGVVKVTDSNWQGEVNTFVNVQKSYVYDGDLRPHPTLNNFDNRIEGAFTSPVLVE
jgi:hypothetical protein